MTTLNAKAYVYGFVDERTKLCRSQHNLPTRQEIEELMLADFFFRGVLLEALDALVKEGKIIQQGPYYGTELKECL